MNVSTKAGFVLVVVLGAAGVASAQETPNPPSPPPAQTPVTAPTPPPKPISPLSADAAIIPMPLSVAELRRRRTAIDAMEGSLPAMVRAAATDTKTQIEELQQQPVNFLTNSVPKARGFHLEGYGVFFYVEIPGVRSSVASAFEQIQKSRERFDRGANASRAAESTGVLPFDPNATYTNAVKQRLIDALLDYSQALDLRPNEWLTIAARDGDEPIPNVIYESITMVVRARGADLADFRANRLSREEMLKRVEVRGF